MSVDNAFLSKTSERADLNQYWFSPGTIGTFVAEVEASGGSAALVSTPSIYFSLPKAVREKSKVLDYDKQWSHDPGFVFYDFNAPEDVPVDLQNTFDFVLVDPPFITPEVWAKYAITTRLLVKAGGRVLCTTIAENACMMKELLDLHPVLFRPSIPNLVYQYSVYVNYDSSRLDALNPEIDDEDWMADLQRKDSPQRILCESSKGNLAENIQVSGAKINQDTSDCLPIGITDDDASLIPEVALLTELRGLLNGMKRSAEAINAPLQTAVRRRQAGGEAALAAREKVEIALDAAQSSVSDLVAWLQSNSLATALALEESPDALATSMEQDRFRTQAVSNMIKKARNSSDTLSTMAAYNDFVMSSKQHVAAVFRQSNAVMDRIKLLKRNAIAAKVQN